MAFIADVFEAMPQRPQILRFQESHGRLQWRKRQAIARHVRGLGFSHALILPHSLKSSLIPWLAGIPHRIGHVGEHRFGLVNRRPLGRAGKAREQNKPVAHLTDILIDPIDKSTERQEWRH